MFSSAQDFVWNPNQSVHPWTDFTMVKAVTIKAKRGQLITHSLPVYQPRVMGSYKWPTSFTDLDIGS